MTSITTATPSLHETRLREKNDTALHSVARDLESNFLAEMLKSAGVGAQRDALGGGAGEDQFSGYLVREYAEAIVGAGGFGLSEAIYRSLIRDEPAR